MKVTQENIKDIEFIYSYINLNLEQSKNLLSSLLLDIEELNNELDNKGESYKKLYIDYEDEHTEYSDEYIEPMPDHYGTFRLRFESNPSETVGDYMHLHDLDTVICALVNFVEF